VRVEGGGVDGLEGRRRSSPHEPLADGALVSPPLPRDAPQRVAGEEPGPPRDLAQERQVGIELALGLAQRLVEAMRGAVAAGDQLLDLADLLGARLRITRVVHVGLRDEEPLAALRLECLVRAGDLGRDGSDPRLRERGQRALEEQVRRGDERPREVPDERAVNLRVAHVRGANALARGDECPDLEHRRERVDHELALESWIRLPQQVEAGPGDEPGERDDDLPVEFVEAGRELRNMWRAGGGLARYVGSAVSRPAAGGDARGSTRAGSSTRGAEPAALTRRASPVQVSRTSRPSSDENRWNRSVDGSSEERRTPASAGSPALRNADLHRLSARRCRRGRWASARAPGPRSRSPTRCPPRRRPR